MLFVHLAWIARTFLAQLQTWRAIIFSRVCLSVCPWPALLPFNVTRTLLWSSLAATIMAQIVRRGTARCLFENFQKFSKITEFEFQNSAPSFFESVSPVYCKQNLDSIRTKLTEEIDFEVCPCDDCGNGTAAAAQHSTGYSDWTGGAVVCSDRSSGAFRTGEVLHFKDDRLQWNLVTRTLLWSSLAATIMVQIGCRGTVWRLFQNFKKF